MQPSESSPRPEPTRASSRTTTIIAWIVIIVTLGIVVGSNAYQARHSEQRKKAVADVQMMMVARYAVGVKALLHRAAPQANHETTLSGLLSQVDAEAHSDEGRLRSAIVAGEMENAESALKRLNTPHWAPIQPMQRDAETLRRIYRQGPESVSAEGAKQLVDHLGWLGKLALSFDRDENDSQRQAAIRPALRLVIAMFTGFAIGLLALLAGLGVLIVAAVQITSGRVKNAYHPTAVNTGPFLEAFAIYLAGSVALANLSRLLFPQSSLFSGIAAMLIVTPLAMLWPRLRGVSWPELRYGLGWHTGRGAPIEIAAGLLGYLAGLPLLAAAAVCSAILGHYAGSNAAHPIITEVRGGFANAIALYALASIWAPLVEETLFRGSLFHYLRSRHTWIVSALVSSLIFAALHPQGWTAIPVLGTIALVFAAIREWRGSFLASASAHALNNAIAVTFLLLAVG